MLHIAFAPLIGVELEVASVSTRPERVFLNIDAPDSFIVAEATAENQENATFRQPAQQASA
jgi:hypothetical protein